MSSPGPVLAGLAVSDSPERWAALGFAVDAGGELRVGAVRITLGIAPPGHGIVGWTLRGHVGEGDLAGLSTRRAPAEADEPGAAADPAVEHPNRATAIDHVVIAVPDLDAFGTEADGRGVGFTRTRELRGRRMGFRRIGTAIMEVVEDSGCPAPRFWGVTFAVAHRADLDALAGRRWVGPARDALQPGRRIAAVIADAGLSTRVAFMDP